MKLVSKVFRAGGSTHVLDGVSYRFCEENPLEGSKHDNPDLQHVCNVQDDAAVEAFLLTGGFTIYSEGAGKVEKPARPGSSTPPPVPVGTVDPAKVAEIHKLTVGDLKENIATYSDVDLAAAAELERNDGSPRVTFIAAIEAHLAPAP